MYVEYAQLPPPEDSADRIFITDTAVIVLDGATAFVPVPVSAQAYADHLGRRLVDQLAADPEVNLREALAQAIRQTAKNLALRPGESPSSTVAILRERAHIYDMLVLGDSPIIWGNENECHILTDNRLAELPLPQREEYKARLRAGHGYDERHRELLRDLQAAQARYRNIEGGYWIAEADPASAARAYSTSVQRRAGWAILMSDGAFDFLDQLSPKPWARIASARPSHLEQLLCRIYDWEQTGDPDGQILPRAKGHDDKSIVAAHLATAFCA